MPEEAEKELTEEDMELTEEEMDLQGYHSLYREVGISPRDSIAECKKMLKSTLVNIVDLIDARRTQKKVVVWLDFEAFRTYTLRNENRINQKEAEEMDGGYLASLLQHLRGPRLTRKERRGKRPNTSAVISGRVTKPESG